MATQTELLPFQQEALRFQQRLSLGDDISLEELKTFILQAESELKTQQKGERKASKEVDFF